MKLPRLAFLSILVFAAAPDAAAAQCPAEGCPPPGTTWQGELGTAAVNAVLGGLTAGIVRELRGGSFAEGFVIGSAGGALVYAGKRVAVEEWYGAGLVGRQIGAVGTSVVRNAAEERQPFERLVFPAGPVRLYVSTGEGVRVQPRLEVLGTAQVIYVALRDDAVFDLDESVSAGAPVFRIYSDVKWDGYQAAGVMYLAYPAETRERPQDLSVEFLQEVESTGAHERVHVLQDDQMFLWLAAPMEDWLFERAEWSRRVHGFLDLGLSRLIWALPGSLVPYDAQPWEREAEYLSRLGNRE